MPRVWRSVRRKVVKPISSNVLVSNQVAFSALSLAETSAVSSVLSASSIVLGQLLLRPVNVELVYSAA
jgi:hypothetical protein